MMGGTKEAEGADGCCVFPQRLHKSEAQNKKAKNAEALSGAMEQNFLNAFSLSGPAPVNKGLGHGGKKLL